jgi:MFS family permease
METPPIEEKPQNQYRNNMKKFYVAAALFNNWLIIPISMIYFLEMGLTYSQIAWMEVINGIFVFFLDIPSGSFADKYGRKITVTIAYLLWGIGILIIGLNTGFWMFLIGYILMAISEAASSGSDNALIYDSLKVEGKEDKYLKIESKVWFIASVSLIVGSILGGYIYNHNKSLPWIISGIIVIIGSFFIASMKEPPLSESSQKRNHKEQITEGFRSIQKNPKVKFLIGYSLFLIIPIAVFVNIIEQPFLVSIGYNYIQLGFIFAFSRGIMGALTLKADVVEKRLGLKKSFIIVHLGQLLIFLLLSLLQVPWIIIFMFIAFLFRDYFNLINRKYINKEVTSDLRATIGSISNSLFNIFFSIAFLVVGYLLDSQPANFILLGFVIYLLVGVPFFLKLKQFPKDYYIEHNDPNTSIKNE